MAPSENLGRWPQGTVGLQYGDLSDAVEGHSFVIEGVEDSEPGQSFCLPYRRQVPDWTRTPLTPHGGVPLKIEEQSFEEGVRSGVPASHNLEVPVERVGCDDTATLDRHRVSCPQRFFQLACDLLLGFCEFTLAHKTCAVRDYLALGSHLPADELVRAPGHLSTCDAPPIVNDVVHESDFFGPKLCEVGFAESEDAPLAVSVEVILPLGCLTPNYHIVEDRPEAARGGAVLQGKVLLARDGLPVLDVGVEVGDEQDFVLLHCPERLIVLRLAGDVQDEFLQSGIRKMPTAGRCDLFANPCYGLPPMPRHGFSPPSRSALDSQPPLLVYTHQILPHGPARSLLLVLVVAIPPVLRPARAGGLAGNLSALLRGQLCQPRLTAFAPDGRKKLTHRLRGVAHAMHST